MQVSGSASIYGRQDLAFQIKTSSGDLIDMSMYKESSAAYSESTADGMMTKTTELSFSQGYKFHYEGNGIDANDQKEIQEALKKLKPEIEKFMAKSQGDEEAQKTSKPEDWLAAFSAQSLPMPKNEDTQNMQKEALAQTFDDSMKKFNPTEQLFSDSKRLFDKILQLLDGKKQIQYA